MKFFKKTIHYNIWLFSVYFSMILFVLALIFLIYSGLTVDFDTEDPTGLYGFVYKMGLGINIFATVFLGSLLFTAKNKWIRFYGTTIGIFILLILGLGFFCLSILGISGYPLFLLLPFVVSSCIVTVFSAMQDWVTDSFK